jgi:hypothetical protein
VAGYKTAVDRLMDGTLGHTTETHKSVLMESNLFLPCTLS